MKDRIMIIDGNSLINRAFYAIQNLSSKDGTPTNGVYGFLNMIFKIMDEYDPKYMSVAFDLKGPTFRHLAYEDYKGTRKGMPDELRVQIPILKDLLDKLGIHRTELQGFEADDLIGTIAKLCSKNDMEVFIVTGDKDALQLADDNTTVLITKKGISSVMPYTPKTVMEEFELTPDQIIDYKGLSGDTSDNIPGIPSFGPKTAIKLLKEFETVENLIKNCEQVSNKRWRGLIEEYSEQALLSKRLATIETNVPIEFELNEFLIGEKDVESLIELYKKYGFKLFLDNLRNDVGTSDDYVVQNTSDEVESIIIKDAEALEGLIKSLSKKDLISIRAFYDKNNIREDIILAYSLYDGEKSYFINFDDDSKMMSIFRSLLEDENIKKVAFDAKKEYLIAFRYGIELKGMEFDILIGDYLLEPGRSKYDFAELTLEYCGVGVKSEEELLGKGAKSITYKDVEIEQLATYGSTWTKYVYELRTPILDKLKELELTDLFYDVEMKLIEVLASTEFEGFSVDVSVLDELDIELTEKIAQMTAEIYSYSDVEFNINSPKQLGEILFDKLRLPVIKRTKTGYSTSHDILEKLLNEHPIVPLIIDYRTYTKLKSTYVDGLKAVINPTTGKVHSSLNQTVAVTGRLSSTDPNMQNIPVRIPLGRKIRKVFIPTDGNTLVDADYSQIELRILAHMSDDPNLVKAFKENIDIHTLTASQVFEVPVEEVSSLERSRAKEVNFGIIYGMSDFGLSENLNITRKTAKEYIDQYFNKYPSVKQFMDREIQKCRDNGYVVTILNRRRYIPEINHKNFNLRSFAERTAMNTPIQGSAADIIKIAMIKVYEELKNQKLKSKLILQVHDELIIDTYRDELEAVEKIIVECMESAYELNVPLRADMNVGDSWYDTK